MVWLELYAFASFSMCGSFSVQTLLCPSSASGTFSLLSQYDFNFKGSNIGVRHPDMFEPDTVSQGEEKELIMHHIRMIFTFVLSSTKLILTSAICQDRLYYMDFPFPGWVTSPF